MKRFIFTTIAASAAIFLAAGCQDLNDIDQPSESIDRNVITASIPEAITRVSMNTPDDGKGLSLAWEDGDELTVIGETTEQFTIAEGFTAHNAQFNGQEVDGESFTILYPGQTYKTVEEINAVSYLNQTQKGNGNTDHLFYQAMIENTSDYTSLDFSSAKQNGVIKFLFQLPEGAGVVESVSLSAASDIFYTTNDLDGEKTNTLTLNLEDVDVSASEQMLTAYMMIPWHDVVLAGGSKLRITVNMPESKFEQVLVREEGRTILAGKVNVIGLNDKSWTEPLFFGGNGTKADPYQIKTYTHLDNVRKMLVKDAETMVYFKMVDDIDMAGKDWTMYNGSVNNAYKYDFDGNNKTISNFSMTGSGASFFGALTGGSKVHNLKFDTVHISDDPEANANNGNSAAVITYNLLGNSIIDNVDIKNVVIQANYSRGNNTGTGAIASRVYEGTIQYCDIDGVTISGTSDRVGGIAGVSAHADNIFQYNTVTNAELSGIGCVGGIVGRSSSTNAPTIKYCSFKTAAGKSITCTETNLTTTKDDKTSINENINVGGIIATAGGAVTIEGCTVEATISTTTYYTGGIVGYIKGAEKSSILGCSVTKSDISSNCTHTGGIIGYAGTNCDLEIKNCIVNSTISNTANINTGVFTGGIVGAAGGTVSLDKCSMKGNIIATERAVGGIIGGTESSNTPVVNECAYLEGTIQGKYRNGGIVGYAPGSVIITNCYSSGILKGSGYSGGIVGFYEGKVTGKTISNCYSTMTNENTGNANAGIVGCFGSSTDTTRDTQNTGTVTKCIAWNDNVAGTTRNTCGCIVGAAGRMSTLADNFYNPLMTTGFTKTTHENSDANNPLETYDSYDGKAAGADETVSSIAENTLGWSGDIWDFTTDLPTLKNLPK